MQEGIRYIVHKNKIYTIYCTDIERIKISRDIKKSDGMDARYSIR